MTISSPDVRWTVADLEVLPEDGRRYEIIDGELFVTRAPHWKHQNVSVKIGMALEGWSPHGGRSSGTRWADCDLDHGPGASI